MVAEHDCGVILSEIQAAQPRELHETWIVVDQEWFDKFYNYALYPQSKPAPGVITFSKLIDRSTHNANDTDSENLFSTQHLNDIPFEELDFPILKQKTKENIDFSLIREDHFEKLDEIFAHEPEKLIKITTEMASFPSEKLFIDLRPILINVFIISATIKLQKQFVFSRLTSLNKMFMDFASGYKLDVNAHFNVKICQYNRDKTILEISKGDDSLDKSLEFNEIQHNDAILFDIYENGVSILENNSFKSWIYSSMGKWLSYFGLTNKCSKRPALNNINAMSPYNEMNEFHEQAHVALAGLYNLGNTCYFNSALQILFAIPEFKKYFINPQFQSEINRTNPLGTHGALANSIHSHLKKISHSSDVSNAVSPKAIKYAISAFAIQFQDMEQHDAQELMTFLLDGLHEDLNRVIKKPYYEESVPCFLNGKRILDHDIANESWRRHISRNESIIVDLFHGLLKSTVTCPNSSCKRTSLTFDPFFFLSVPVPSFPQEFFCKVVFMDFCKENNFACGDMLIKLNQANAHKKIAAQLGFSQSELEYCVYSTATNRLIYLLSDCRNLTERSQVFVFRKLNDSAKVPVIVNLRLIDQGFKNESAFMIKKDEILMPFLVHLKPRNNDYQTLISKLIKIIAFIYPESFVDDKISKKFIDAINLFTKTGYQKQALFTSDCVLNFEENQTELLIKIDKSRLDPRVELDDIDNYVFQPLNLEHSTEIFSQKLASNSTIFDCISMFMNEEQLLQDNLWYCSNCKEHVRAFKKMSVWQLPPIIFIHFKRFRFNLIYRGAKINTLIDFPLRDLDLSACFEKKPDVELPKYDLIGVVNHFGSLSGGHYTASIYNDQLKNWYDCDDSRVTPIASPPKNYAYILAYKRQSVGSEKMSSG